jgi:protein-S-isoprenylcysteine O-methyltransferase Ste14
LADPVRPPIFVGSGGGSVAMVVAFWVVFYGWIGAELWLGYRNRRLPGGATDRDSGSKAWLIGSVWTAVAVGIGLGFAFPDAAIRSGRTPIFVAGLVLMLAGMALRWYAVWVLGPSFTVDVATRPGQTVVESGPYRWIRHPSYTGGLLTLLGVLVCCCNPVSLVALVIALAGYGHRIRIEEEALATDLGAPYRDYMRRTKRLIPFVV